ncbi:basic proline-rich protein-like [Tachyglossus aculeatus]|uniref:basic proline-rich protein-like n=1 Tax=Tachyglossus aculeatus TaxID=9261 RepID=UPI0018F6F67C|nr:basic proline-rich protein-like [Tachyglossus aculeatus]
MDIPSPLQPANLGGGLCQWGDGRPVGSRGLWVDPLARGGPDWRVPGLQGDPPKPRPPPSARSPAAPGHPGGDQGHRAWPDPRPPLCQPLWVASHVFAQTGWPHPTRVTLPLPLCGDGREAGVPSGAIGPMEFVFQPRVRRQGTPAFDPKGRAGSRCNVLKPCLSVPQKAKLTSQTLPARREPIWAGPEYPVLIGPSGAPPRGGRALSDWRAGSRGGQYSVRQPPSDFATRGRRILLTGRISSLPPGGAAPSGRRTLLTGRISFLPPGGAAPLGRRTLLTGRTSFLPPGGRCTQRPPPYPSPTIRGRHSPPVEGRYGCRGAKASVLTLRAGDAPPLPPEGASPYEPRGATAAVPAASLLRHQGAPRPTCLGDPLERGRRSLRAEGRYGFRACDIPPPPPGGATPHLPRGPSGTAVSLHHQGGHRSLRAEGRYGFRACDIPLPPPGGATPHLPRGPPGTAVSLRHQGALRLPSSPFGPAMSLLRHQRAPLPTSRGALRLPCRRHPSSPPGGAAPHLLGGPLDLRRSSATRVRYGLRPHPSGRQHPSSATRGRRSLLAEGRYLQPPPAPSLPGALWAGGVPPPPGDATYSSARFLPAGDIPPRPPEGAAPHRPRGPSGPGALRTGGVPPPPGGATASILTPRAGDIPPLPPGGATYSFRPRPLCRRHPSSATRGRRSLLAKGHYLQPLPTPSSATRGRRAPPA